MEENITRDSKEFVSFKKEVVSRLSANATHLGFHETLILLMPLAAEEVKD